MQPADGGIAVCGSLRVCVAWVWRSRKNGLRMNIVILDDYQDAVRKLQCASHLDNYSAKVYTNTVKGLGQLSVRLRDADIIVLIRERTHINRLLLEKLPRLKMIAQTGRVGSHVDGLARRPVLAR